MVRNEEATLIIAASERDSNLYYATGFLAPDPFIFAEIRGRKIVLMSELELDRARREAEADEVIPTGKITAKLKRAGVTPITAAEMVHALFRERRVKCVLVPSDFPIEHADALRKKGYKIRFKPDPFYSERTIKNKKEVAAITQTLRHTERAVREAVHVLTKARIKGRYLMYKGKRLTAETLKQIINVSLMESGCIAAHTIVSSGRQCVDPHHQGSGPLPAHESIVMDVFPRQHPRHRLPLFRRHDANGGARESGREIKKDVPRGQRRARNRIQADSRWRRWKKDSRCYFAPIRKAWLSDRPNRRPHAGFFPRNRPRRRP